MRGEEASITDDLRLELRGTKTRINKSIQQFVWTLQSIRSIDTLLSCSPHKQYHMSLPFFTSHRTTTTHSLTHTSFKRPSVIRFPGEWPSGQTVFADWITQLLAHFLSFWASFWRIIIIVFNLLNRPRKLFCSLGKIRMKPFSAFLDIWAFSEGW